MAYTAAVVLDTRGAVQIGKNSPLHCVSGKCNITAYHATLAEITAITKHFRVVKAVVTDGASDAGYIFDWNRTSKAFKVYKDDLSASTDGPMVEAGNDADVGEVEFIAFGLC